MARLLTVAIVAGSMVGYAVLAGHGSLVQPSWANPFSSFHIGQGPSNSDDDPFERWLTELRRKHDDFVATAECRKRLAELQTFWAQEGITGATVNLPPACIRKT